MFGTATATSESMRMPTVFILIIAFLTTGITMRRFALAILAIVALTAGFAHASCYISDDIRTLRLHPPVSGTTLVQRCDAIITAVRADSVYVSQAPHGAWNAIFVYWPGHTYTGSCVPAPGDLVNICGVYTRVCGLDTIDIAAAMTWGYVVKIGTAPVPPVSYETAAGLMASPEHWESVLIMIIDGMTVPTGNDLGSGTWAVEAQDGTDLRFGSFWYDFGNVAAGQYYPEETAVGILHDACGTYVFQPFAYIMVDVESVSLGSLKATFR